MRARLYPSVVDAGKTDTCDRQCPGLSWQGLLVTMAPSQRAFPDLTLACGSEALCPNPSVIGNRLCEPVARTRYFLSRASLHFPFLKYMNAPHVRCRGAVSARKPAGRRTVGRLFMRTGASAVCDLAEAVALLAEAPAGGRTRQRIARASEGLNIGLSLEHFSVHLSNDRP